MLARTWARAYQATRRVLRFFECVLRVALVRTDVMAEKVRVVPVTAAEPLTREDARGRSEPRSCADSASRRRRSASATTSA